MKVAVTATWPRIFRNGQQSFSRLLVRFNIDHYNSWPLLNHLWHDLPNTPDGWPVGFDNSEKREQVIRKQMETSCEVRFFQFAELEAEVPTEHLALVLAQVRAAGQQHRTTTPAQS